jgi:hypothetical protein
MVVDDKVEDKMGIISAVTMSSSCGGCIGSEIVLGAVSNFVAGRVSASDSWIRQ